MDAQSQAGASLGTRWLTHLDVERRGRVCLATRAESEAGAGIEEGDVRGHDLGKRRVPVSDGGHIGHSLQRRCVQGVLDDHIWVHAIRGHGDTIGALVEVEGIVSVVLQRVGVRRTPRARAALGTFCAPNRGGLRSDPKAGTRIPPSRARPPRCHGLVETGAAHHPNSDDRKSAQAVAGAEAAGPPPKPLRRWLLPGCGHVCDKPQLRYNAVAETSMYSPSLELCGPTIRHRYFPVEVTGTNHSKATYLRVHTRRGSRSGCRHPPLLGARRIQLPGFG